MQKNNLDLFDLQAILKVKKGSLKIIHRLIGLPKYQNKSLQ